MYVDSIVYKGRPADVSGRQDKEIAVYDLLERLDIPFFRLDHGEAKTMADCDEIDRLLEIPYCKNLFLSNTQETAFYLLILPNYKKFKAGGLSRQIGTARLSFGKPQYMEEYLNILPGSVSVMGLMNDTNRKVQLLIDTEAMGEGYMTCHPCVNTTSIKLKTEDLFDKFLKYIGHEAVFVTL